MSKSYNYQAASLEEVAFKFNSITNQAYSHLTTYYENKGDSEMVRKLQQARMLSRIRKMGAEYFALYGVEASL